MLRKSNPCTEYGNCHYGCLGSMCNPQTLRPLSYPLHSHCILTLPILLPWPLQMGESVPLHIIAYTLDLRYALERTPHLGLGSRRRALSWQDVQEAALENGSV